MTQGESRRPDLFQSLSLEEFAKLHGPSEADVRGAMERGRKAAERAREANRTPPWGGMEPPKPRKLPKPKGLRSKETVLVKAILDTLAMFPDVMAWRNNTGAVRVPGDSKGAPPGHPLAGIVPFQRRKGRFIRYGEVGSADIHAVVGPRGRFLSIEAKSATGTMTDAQKQWMAKVKRMGGVAIMAKDVKTVTDTIQAMRAGTI